MAADESRITSQLWTGGAIQTEADVQQLVDWGITADIDCRLEFDDESLVAGYEDLPNAGSIIAAHPALEYLWNGVPDDGEPKPVSWFKKSWDFALPLLTDGGVVLAHCAAGHNRGPSTCYFLLRAYNGVDSATAYQMITSKRPVARIGYREDADRAIQALGL